MIGGKLRQMAEGLGMTAASGVAYGQVEGYMLTLSEDGRTISLSVGAMFDKSGDADAFAAVLKSKQNRKQYSIADCILADRFLCVKFASSLKAHERIAAFISEALLPGLDGAGAAKADICAYCNKELAGRGDAYLLDNIAYQMHEECVEEMREVQQSEAQRLRDQPKNVPMGILGAVIGGLIGSIPWILIAYLGWYVGWLGFIIGIAAKFGYEKLGGKPCFAKLIVVFAVTIACVIFSAFVGYEISLISYMIAEEGYLLSDFDLVYAFRVLISAGDVWTELASNLLIGGALAIAGVWGLMKDMNRERRGITIEIKKLAA